jgi:hypothetical protein
MKYSATPDAVSTDTALLGAGFLALLVVGVFLFWLGVASPPEDLADRAVRA